VDVSKFCGWTPNPAGVQAVLAKMPHPHFADAAPDLFVAPADRDAFLWEACKKVTGDNLPAHIQSIGCCTSEGSASAVDYLQCVQIALNNSPEEFKSISHAFMYG
jgi:hypothetical protein